jgi:hypothetical protein
MQLVWVEISVLRDSMGQPLLFVENHLLSAHYGNLFKAHLYNETNVMHF